MSFRLLPKSVTLNDLDGRVFYVISPNSVAFRARYVKVFENTPAHSAREM